MNHICRTVALATMGVVASAGAMVPAALPAVAATPTVHCTPSKEIGVSKAKVSLCAHVVTPKKGKQVAETVTVRNNGSKAVTVHGDVGVSAGQGGSGGSIDRVTIEPGHARQFRQIFSVPKSGPYSVGASMGTAHASASVHLKFSS